MEAVLRFIESGKLTNTRPMGKEFNAFSEIDRHKNDQNRQSDDHGKTHRPLSPFVLLFILLYLMRKH